MKTATVPSSWMRHNELRLDSGPYLQGGVQARILLEKLRAVKTPLRELTIGPVGGIYNGPKFSRNYVDGPTVGVPFLSSSLMLHADLSVTPFLRRKDAESPRLSYLRLQRETALVSCSGTIGRMVYVRSAMEGMWSSQHIMKIVPNSDIILPGYLYSFLTSSFGLPMIVSGTYGAIIQHIEPSHISDLPIPRFSHGIEEQAHTYISQAAALRDAYQTGVLQATALLFESLGLKDIIPTEWRQMGQELGFSPETISADSLRAINYSPRVRQLVQRLSSAPHMPLGKICHDGMLRSGARFKRVDCDPEQGVKLIGQKELFWLEPEGRWISAKHAPQDIFVKDETIMVAAQGTLGENEVFSRAEFVTGPWTAFAFTQHLLRVRPGVPDISGAFLFAFLRSETAFRYIRSISTGSKQQDIHRHFLAQLPVPLPPIEVRRQIELLIRDAYAARHRASALEQTAIKLVEEAIEENR